MMLDEEESIRQKKCCNCAAGVCLAILVVAFATMHSIPRVKINAAFARKNSTSTFAESAHSMPPWMTAYVDLHKSRIVKKADGTLQYTNDPYLKWTCRVMGSCGGLGDRLNGIIMSLYMAILTNRTFILEQGWQTPANMTAFLQPASIRWNLSAPSYANKRISTIDQCQHPYLTEPCKQHDPAKGIEFQNNLMTDEAQLAESCMNDYWKQFGGRQDDRSLFHIGFWALFRFTPLVDQSANQLRQRAGMKGSNDPYVAVHIRTGQGATWEDPVRHGTTQDLHSFYQCALKIQTGLKQRYQTTTMPSIYSAADNNTAKELIQSWNQDGTVMAVTDLEVFHIDRTRVNELKDFDQAYSDVWGELKVLIDATCLVMSRSGFSKLGSQISHQQPRCAIMFNECSDANVTKVLNRLK